MDFNTKIYMVMMTFFLIFDLFMYVMNQKNQLDNTNQALGQFPGRNHPIEMPSSFSRISTIADDSASFTTSTTAFGDSITGAGSDNSALIGRIVSQLTPLIQVLFLPAASPS